MDKYYRTGGAFIIDTSNITIRTRYNKDTTALDNIVPITVWRDESSCSALLYNTNSHTVYNIDDKPLASLPNKKQSDIKRFGTINSIDNIIIIHDKTETNPAGFEVFSSFPKEVQSMYRLPITPNTNVYAIYRKDRVTLMNRVGLAEIKQKLKKVKNKEAPIMLWGVKPSKSDDLLKYQMSNKKALDSINTIGDFLSTPLTGNNKPTFITIDYDSFNQAFFPKHNLPEGAEPLQPEEYNKFRNIESNTDFLPFKKDGEYYAIIFNNNIVPLGSDPEKIKCVYCGADYDGNDVHYTVAKAEDDAVTIYDVENNTPSRIFNEVKELKKFKHIRGFGLDELDYIIEDNKGVIHTYTFKDNDLVETNDVFSSLIKAATLKNTLAHGITSEAAQQYLSAICQ